MSFLRNLYFFQGEKYTSFGKNILHRQSASLGHSATGHSGYKLNQPIIVSVYRRGGEVRSQGVRGHGGGHHRAAAAALLPQRAGGRGVAAGHRPGEL